MHARSFQRDLSEAKKKIIRFLCFIDCAPPYSLTNNASRCTILFRYIYLCLFSTCFGHSSAHPQEKITISLRHWYLSLCMFGVLSADQTPHIHSDKYKCRIDTVIFSWWLALECPKHVKSIPLQAWSDPEGSRKLRFPDFMTTAQRGGKVVSHTHRPHLTPRNSPGTHFY